MGRHGMFDIMMNHEKKYVYEYDREYCDMLLEYDRYAQIDRVAFYELMRISLPAYSIHFEDDSEVKIEMFFSIYNNGYVGITHVYKDLDCILSDKFNKPIELWMMSKH